jgi:hypothetical protein
LQAAICFARTDEDAIRIFQIADGRSFRQELGIGEDVETDAVLTAVQDPFHGECGLHRQGALFDDDLGRFRELKDLSGGFFPVLKIGGHAGPETEGFGRCVHADEDDVVLPDTCFDIGAEEEIPSACCPDEAIQIGFEDGEIVGIPGRNPFGVDVHDRHPVAGALAGNHGHGRAADITGPDAEDVLFEGHSVLNGLSS